jgi:hypothetical protein
MAKTAMYTIGIAELEVHLIKSRWWLIERLQLDGRRYSVNA